MSPLCTWVLILLIPLQSVKAQQNITIKGEPFTVWGQSAGKIVYAEGKQSTEFFWHITPDSSKHLVPNGVKYFTCTMIKIFDSSFNNTDLTIHFLPLHKLAVTYFDKGLPEEKQLFSVPAYKVILRTRDNNKDVEVLANYRHADFNGLSRQTNSNEILVVFKEKAEADAFVKLMKEIK